MSTEDVAVYAAVDAGGMADNPEFPTFEDGHRENLIGEAVERSARERRWVGVIGGSSTS
jgi:hypothetical protein